MLWGQGRVVRRTSQHHIRGVTKELNVYDLCFFSDCRSWLTRCNWNTDQSSLKLTPSLIQSFIQSVHLVSGQDRGTMILRTSQEWMFLKNVYFYLFNIRNQITKSRRIILCHQNVWTRLWSHWNLIISLTVHAVSYDTKGKGVFEEDIERRHDVIVLYCWKFMTIS